MREVFKKMLFPVMAVFVLVVFNANLAEAKSLKKGEVFSLIRNGEINGTIEVISSSELEITGNENRKTLVAEYGFKGDKLRVVVNVSGTKMVLYYLLTKEGLKEDKEKGDVYFSKAGLAAEEKRNKFTGDGVESCFVAFGGK